MELEYENSVNIDKKIRANERFTCSQLDNTILLLHLKTTFLHGYPLKARFIYSQPSIEQLAPVSPCITSDGACCCK